MRKGMAQTLSESMMHSTTVGDYSQGQALTELSLANQFEMSRTPVREACVLLHNEGFLRATARKGYVLREVSLDEIRELDQLRQMPESPLHSSDTISFPPQGRSRRGSGSTLAKLTAHLTPCGRPEERITP